MRWILHFAMTCLLGDAICPHEMRVKKCVQTAVPIPTIFVIIHETLSRLEAYKEGGKLNGATLVPATAATVIHPGVRQVTHINLNSDNKLRYDSGRMRKRGLIRLESHGSFKDKPLRVVIGLVRRTHVSGWKRHPSLRKQLKVCQVQHSFRYLFISSSSSAASPLTMTYRAR